MSKDSALSVILNTVTAQGSERVVAMEGQPVNLTCKTPSGEQAVWYYNEIPLSSGRNRIFTRDMMISTLTILDPKMKNAGRYTCIDPAQTPTNLFSKDYSLVVQSKSLTIIILLLTTQ